MGKSIIMVNGYAILPGVSGKKAMTVALGKQADAAKDKDVPPYEYTGLKVSWWGDNNLFPQDVLKDLEKNSVGLRALEKRKTVHYGRGIIAYRESSVIDATGNFKKEIVKDPEVVDFFKLNRLNLNWIQVIGSLEIFANAWPEFILNKGMDKINRVYPKDPAYCRYEKMNPDTARIENLYYSARWEMFPALGDTKKVLTIPMYDPLKYDGRHYADPKFIYPMFYKSFNKSYYHLSVWNGVRASGWMDVANKIAPLKLAIMKNQMVIKYHVVVPDYYFATKYPSPDYTAEARESKIKNELTDLNDFLTDIENSGKAFISFAFWDKTSQKLKEGWQFTVLDNKLDNGSYLPDSQAANSEILFGIGVDPTLIGAGIPGGKLGAGSGSDKREAFWQLNAEMGIYRQISLDPLYFIRDFNGWDPAIQFDYAVVDTSQTQNQHPTKINQNLDITQGD